MCAQVSPKLIYSSGAQSSSKHWTAEGANLSLSLSLKAISCFHSKFTHMVRQAALIQSSAKERETAAKLQESEKALQDALQELNDTKANEKYYMAECQRLHDELQSRPDQPWKLAGLKKCNNKCKKFCWDGTGKFCVNMGCSTNVKTVAEASMQTGEDVADVIVDEKRFEELTPVIPTDEHEARMQAWRAATEAVEPPATTEATPSAPTTEAAPSFFGWGGGRCHHHWGKASQETQAEHTNDFCHTECL